MHQLEQECSSYRSRYKFGIKISMYFKLRPLGLDRKSESSWVVVSSCGWGIWNIPGTWWKMFALKMFPVFQMDVREDKIRTEVMSGVRSLNNRTDMGWKHVELCSCLKWTPRFVRIRTFAAVQICVKLESDNLLLLWIVPQSGRDVRMFGAFNLVYAHVNFCMKLYFKVRWALPGLQNQAVRNSETFVQH